MPIFLQENDQIALAAAWKERSDKVFQDKIVSDFTELMLNKIMHRDIAAELLECIKHAKKPSEICVSWGLCFEPNHYFMAEGFGKRRFSIKQIIYRTNALEQLAESIGKNIKVAPHYWNDVIYIDIQYWPPRPLRAPRQQINNPEDEVPFGFA